MGDGAVEEGEKQHTMLVDMLVQFTNLPSWNQPLTEFINEKCVLFDNFQEENKHEYVEVHNEFKHLIDNLLTAHLLEVDIDPEAFEKELASSDVAEDARFKQVVSQLMAAEDFVLFKQMMIDNHCNMQAQAETTYKEVSEVDEQTRIAAAVGAASAAEAAGAGQAVGGAAQPPKPASPAKPPTAHEERAFGAAGGAYGRASMPTSPKKHAGTEKAEAIRKALCSAARPK
eukprot:CAMPEP_0171108968 /NCGR_PEP_ID=MMETSP0766_2-20121228/69972_1 /TAXON_ID=439317 /ORGANISM="Gambierdiscus australes, Strain CAWD 149" /LENGTH=228 /DNA_ID=CAMNT_0011570601 /DNA_START=56 /DNA_END=742 /DNA_ORIENTATION=-